MRILSLALLAFGPFEGTTLSFAREPRLEIVFGPNEAGKSTLLRAVGDLLFGVPTITRDAHRHKTADLRIGATLLGPNGETWEVQRRKGKKNTLLLPGGEPADEAKLARWLGGVTRPLFERTYGLDHVRLREGAEELLAVGGDADESLFAASLGAAGLHALRRQLEEQADEIWGPRALKPLNQALKAYTDAKKRAGDVTTRETWESQQSSLASARADRESLRREREGLATERSLLEQLLRGLPLRQGVSERVAKHRNAIMQCSEELAAVPPPTPLLAMASEIDALAERLVAVRRAVLELPGLDAQIAHGEADLGRIAQRLRLASPRDLRVDAPRAAKLRSLGSELHRLQRAVHDEEGRLANAEIELDAARKRLDDAPLAKDVPAVSRALEHMRAEGDLASRVAEADARARSASSLVDAAAKRLGRFGGTAAELLVAPVPTEDIVRVREEELALLDEEEGRHREALQRLDDEGRAVARDLAALTAGGAPPSEADVEAARAERDARWKEVRAAAQKARAPAEEAFTGSLRRADDLVDQLRRDLTRATRLAQLTGEQAALTVRRAQREDEGRALEVRRQRLDAAWNELWSAAEVSPLAPTEMRSWLSGLAEVRRLADEAREAAAEAVRLSGVASLLGAELALALDRKPSALASLVVEAEAAVRGVEARRLREDAVLQAQLAMAKQQRLLTTTKGELERLESTWAAELQVIGLVERLAPEEVEVILEGAADLARATADVERAMGRRDVLRAERDAAAAVVANLLERMGRKVAAAPGEELGTELVTQLRIEREVAQTRTTLEARLAALRAELGDDEPALRLQTERVDGALAALGERFEVSGSDAELIARAEARMEDIVAAEGDVGNRLDRTSHLIGSIELGLGPLETRSLAADASGDMEEALARVRDLTVSYARLRAASVLLRREMERYRELHEAPVLARASELFQSLTHQSFTGLRIELDDADKPVLSAMRPSGTPLGLGSLSEGTRDQLYLALRLATLLRAAERTEPLPVVLDDILVHFDDERSQAALEALALASQHVQILLFTHHARVAEIAERALGSRAFVHRLTAPAQTPGSE